MNRLVQLIYRLSVLVMLSMLSMRRFCCFLHQAFVWFIMTAGLSCLAVEMLEIWTDGSEKKPTSISRLTFFETRFKLLSAHFGSTSTSLPTLTFSVGFIFSFLISPAN